MNILKKAVAVVCALAVTATMTSPRTIGNAFVKAESVQKSDSAQTSAESFSEDYLNFTELDDGTLEVSCDWEHKDDLTKVIIPAEVDGKPVTSIGKFAFMQCTNLTSVTIPDSVSNIGSGAFYDCANLVSVDIPESVSYIGSEAFEGCGSLGFVNALTKMETTQASGEYPTSGKCGDNLTWQLDSTGTLTISGTGEMYYDSDQPFKEWQFRDNIRTVVIESGVTSICYGAFWSCRYLTSVTIPNSVTSIGEQAFCGTNLAAVTIPSSVTSIGNNAFSSCERLTAINVIKDSKNYCSENGVLFNKDKTELICYPAGKTNNTYAIPNGVTNIGGHAFLDCSLTSVTIPNSVTNIGGGAFSNCDSLTSVTILGNVTSIYIYFY